MWQIFPARTTITFLPLNQGDPGEGSNRIQLTTGLTYSFIFDFNTAITAFTGTQEAPLDEVGRLKIQECIPIASDPYTISDNTGVMTGNTLSSTYAADGDFNNNPLSSADNNAAGAKMTWSVAVNGEITVNYLAEPGIGLFVSQFDEDPTTSPPSTIDLSGYAQGSLVFEIKVPDYGSYTDMLVKLDSPPSCGVCEKALGRVGASDWATVSIPISAFPLGTTPETQLDLRQVSSSFVIWPDATNQQAQATLTFMLRNIRWEPTLRVIEDVAPLLANIDSTTPLTMGLGIVPIIFVNDGVAATECSVDTTTTPALPMGLDVALVGDTCQIVGTPMATANQVTYAIVATAANTRTDIATVILTVSATLPTTPAACSSLEQADVTGYPVTAMGFSERLYVRGNFSNWRPHPNFIFRHKGNNIYQAVFTLDSALAVAGYSPARTVFRVTSDDGTQTPANSNSVTQFNVIDDAISNIRLFPLDFFIPYSVDRSDGSGLSDNNLVALQAGGTYIFTLELASANPEDGSDRGTLRIQDCSQVGADPDLLDVTGSQPKSFITGETIDPIIFANMGGAVTDCVVSSGQGASNELPEGLMLVVANGTCQIEGTPLMVSDTSRYIITGSNLMGGDTAFVNIEILSNAPVLADITETKTFTINRAIDPIIFDNTGGAVDSCMVTAGGTPVGLPVGLMFEIVDPDGAGNKENTCQITGAPTMLSPLTPYTIEATKGLDMVRATVSIEVNPPAPGLANITETKIFTINQAIDPIIFTNEAGAVEADGCNVDIALPMGLILAVSGGTCRITGAPRILSDSPILYTITATNAGGPDTATVTIDIRPFVPSLLNILKLQSLAVNEEITPIIFTNTLSPTGSVASCVVTAGGDPVGLPMGLTLEVANHTCQITGRPATTSAPTLYTISATNRGGTDTATTVMIEVVDAPALVNAANQSFPVGQAITPIIFTNNGGAVREGGNRGCEVSSGGTPVGLPMGLVLTVVDGTCQIDGIPAETGSTLYTITATNVAGSDEATVTIVVTLVAPVLANALAQIYMVGDEIDALSFANTSSPVDSCSIASPAPALPQGLELGILGNTCAITGTPTMETSVNTYTITGTNTGGPGTATVMITVHPRPPRWAALTRILVINEPVMLTLTNIGGAVDSCTGGSFTMTTGLSVAVLGDTCQITGTPMMILGSAPYDIVGENAGGTTMNVFIDLEIRASLSAPILANITGTQTFTVGVEITPITFANTGSAVADDGCDVSSDDDAPDNVLPKGLSAVADNGTCQITGTPTEADPSDTYTLTATNMADSSTPTVTIVIVDAPALDNIAEMKSFSVEEEITPITFTNAGGDVAADGCSVEPALPQGLDLDVSGTTCEITGDPGQITTSKLYTITASNGFGGEDTATVTIEVVLAAPRLNSFSDQLYFTATATIDPVTFVNTGGPVQAGGCSASPVLPTGLSLTVVAGTCQISGASTMMASFESYAITAINAGGESNEAYVDFEVSAALAPILADIAETKIYALRPLQSVLSITPIPFTNDGGYVDSCSAMPTLPGGLIVETTGRTCRIIGIPTVAATSRSYNITATNGINSDADTGISIAVVPPSEVPDFDISASSGLTSGNFYSMVYTAATGSVPVFVSDGTTHAKVRWSTDSNTGITMVEYRASVAGEGLFQVTQNPGQAVDTRVNLGNYAEGFIAFDIMVPTPGYGNYTDMVAAYGNKNPVNLGQVGNGNWQTVSFPAISPGTGHTATSILISNVNEIFIIYPDKATQKTEAALTFMIRNIRWTNTDPSP